MKSQHQTDFKYPPHRRFSRQRGLTRGILGLVATVLSVMPVNAAERVYLSFASANVSVSVQALERYAKTGEVDAELASYLLLLSPEDQEQFKNVLLDSFQIDPTMVSQFFNSPTGQIVLDKLGDLVQAQFNQKGTTTLNNGSDAIRTALINAANDPQGFTLLSILHHFPSHGIEVNTQLMFELREQVNTLLKETEAVTEKVVKLSSEEAAKAADIDFSQKPDLRKPGPFSISKRTMTLIDYRRSRAIPVDLYLPNPLENVNQGQQKSIPVIVVSHGLAANRTSFSALGQHLASYGFAAALIQHPGSDTDQVQALLSGQASEVFKVQEFINRPQDISYLLDELERKNQSEFNGQLNLNQVGVAGYSFGAYTALAIAGAEIDFENLEQDCQAEFDSPNLARMFQCRALELPRNLSNFRDPRVKAIMPMNPVNGSIFGQRSLSRLNLPILWKTSGEDKVTPVASEQVRSFTWLTTPDKYFLLAEGDHHINLNLSMVKQTVSDSLKEIVAPVPVTVSNYVNAMGVAFLKVHLANESEYRLYLQAAYAQSISENPYRLSLIRSITAEQFLQAIKAAKQQG